MSWNTPKKIRSRLDTIPRQVSGQYWTLAGLCDQPDCELDYALNIVEPWQFHGVDNNLEIHNQNQAMHPHVNWHYGDFYKQMRAYGDLFNPGFVNYDSYQTVDTAANDIADIIDLIQRFDCVLNINLVLSHRWNRTVQTAEHVLGTLCELPAINNARLSGGEFIPSMYPYDGAGERSATKMGTFRYVTKASQMQVAA